MVCTPLRMAPIKANLLLLAQPPNKIPITPIEEIAIKKKIYSPKYNPCPLKKWDVSDNEHSSIFQKDKKNVI